MTQYKEGDTFIEVTTNKSLIKEGKGEVRYTPMVCTRKSGWIWPPEYYILEDGKTWVGALDPDLLTILGRSAEALSHKSWTSAQRVIVKWLDQEAFGHMYSEETRTHVRYPE